MAKQNLYLSTAKALQPRCLSLSAAESIRISSACDTRCLGGKFNYFSLIRCTIPFCGIFCTEEPRWEGSPCLSLATRVARAESSEICTVFLFDFSFFCPHPRGAISARDWTSHPPSGHLSTSTEVLQPGLAVAQGIRSVRLVAKKLFPSPKPRKHGEERLQDQSAFLLHPPCFPPF